MSEYNAAISPADSALNQLRRIKHTGFTGAPGKFIFPRDLKDGQEAIRFEIFAEYQFDVDQKALNRTFTPSYTKFDGDFAPNSKFDSNLTSAFTNALEAEDYDGAKEIIEGYQSSSFEGNNAKAKTLNEQLDNAIKGITDTAPDDEKETTSVEQLRDVGPRPPLGGGAKGKEERDNWDANYGNLLFRDGTIITDAQKQYILENPRASKDLL